MHRHRNLRIRRGGIAGDGLDCCCLSRNLVLSRNRLGLPVGGCRKRRDRRFDRCPPLATVADAEVYPEEANILAPARAAASAARCASP